MPERLPAAICAALLASVLEGIAADRISEEGSPVLPWTLRSRAGGVSEVGGQGERAYQWSAYQGMTLQAAQPIWIHAGLETREDRPRGLSAAMTQWGVLKTSVGLEILRGFLYATAGGTLPLQASDLPLSDSAALSNYRNQPALLPDGGALLPASLHGGGLVRIAREDWEVSATLSYLRPGRLEVLREAAFYPAPQLSVGGQWDHGRPGVGHQLKWKVTFFGDETNSRRVAAHREGSLWQMRYRVAGLGERDAWDLGFSAGLRTTDRNRKVLIAVDPELSAINDNFQRVALEQAWRVGRGQVPPLALESRTGLLWMPEPVEWGFEQNLSAAYRFLTGRGWQAEVWTQARYLLWQEEDGWALGGGLSFILRHAGGMP